MRPDPVLTARALVAERFPDAVQAWLAGSVTTGRVTSTSDLDVTVLLAEGQVHRESLVYDGWPVELFVHPAGVDRALRRPGRSSSPARDGPPRRPGDPAAARRRRG